MEVLPVMIVFFVLVCFRCDAATDPQEVMSLQEMYRALNFSPQLVGWKAENREPWTGISCAGSSVLNMNLTHNMLSGPMGNVFTGLPSLGEMDLSYNNFTGDLPDSVLARGQAQPPLPQPTPSWCNAEIFGMNHLKMFIYCSLILIALKSADRFLSGMVDMLVYMIRKYCNCLGERPHETAFGLDYE
ncbi:hypothetical protein V2J09_017559 [Rumex salicifolius]